MIPVQRDLERLTDRRIVATLRDVRMPDDRGENGRSADLHRVPAFGEKIVRPRDVPIEGVLWVRRFQPEGISDRKQRPAKFRPVGALAQMQLGKGTVDDRGEFGDSSAVGATNCVSGRAFSILNIFDLPLCARCKA